MQNSSARCLVTGGADLLGTKHAEAISEMGGIPVLIDIDGEKAEACVREITATYGVQGLELHCDITQPEAVANALSRTLAAFGRVDILINNAANAPKVERAGLLS